MFRFFLILVKETWAGSCSGPVPPNIPIATGEAPWKQDVLFLLLGLLLIAGGTYLLKRSKKDTK